MDKYKYKLGKYEGRNYFLFCKAKPSLNDPKEIVLNIFYPSLVKEERVQVVRLDNVHGKLHIDQLWKPGDPKKKIKIRAEDKWELLGKAQKRLIEKWKYYAKKFEESKRK